MDRQGAIMDSNHPISLHSSLVTGCIIRVKIWIPADKVAEFWALQEPVHAVVMAEPEARFYVASENPNEPGCLQWVEGWSKPAEWLVDGIWGKPYFEPYRTIMESWFIKPRELEVSFVKEGRAHFKVPDGWTAQQRRL